MARKPKDRDGYGRIGKRLKAASDKLRLDFVSIDLQLAMTFLSLAKFDFNNGEIGHADRLLTQAERASDIIGKIARELPESTKTRIDPGLTALRSAIEDIRAKK